MFRNILFRPEKDGVFGVGEKDIYLVSTNYNSSRLSCNQTFDLFQDFFIKTKL